MTPPIGMNFSPRSFRAFNLFKPSSGPILSFVLPRHTAFQDENLISCESHVYHLPQKIILAIRYVDEAQDNLMIDALCKQKVLYTFTGSGCDFAKY